MQAFVTTCKLMDLHAFCIHFGTFWNIMNILYTFWNILDHSGTFWNILEHSGTFWNILKHLGTFCMHPGIFWNILPTSDIIVKCSWQAGIGWDLPPACQTGSGTGRVARGVLTPWELEVTASVNARSGKSEGICRGNTVGDI